MAEEGVQLPLQQTTGAYEAVGMGSHVEGQGLDGGRLGPVAGHDLGEGGEEGEALGCLPGVFMVHVTLAFHVRVRGQDDLGLEVPHRPGGGFDQVLEVVETAVAEAQKAHVLHAQKLCGGNGFRLPKLDKRLRRCALEGVFEAVAAVGADEKAHLLPGGDQLRRGGAGAHLDVVRVGTDEQIPVEGLHLRGRSGEPQGEAGEAHAFLLARRAFSSAQMRSYSGSSSL